MGLKIINISTSNHSLQGEELALSRPMACNKPSVPTIFHHVLGMRFSSSYRAKDPSVFRCDSRNYTVLPAALWIVVARNGRGLGGLTYARGRRTSQMGWVGPHERFAIRRKQARQGTSTDTNPRPRP